MLNKSNEHLVLIVDDCEVTLKSLSDFFSRNDFDVISCADGLAGIKNALLFRPDLILLDILMPEFDGIKMLQVIKIIDQIKNIPVIVMSGITNKSTVYTVLEAGASKVLSKPLDEKILAEAINEVFKKHIIRYEHCGLIQPAELEELQKIFLDSFANKKTQIVETVREKNKAGLKKIFHDLKSVSGTIGYSELFDMSLNIEKAAEYLATDWKYVAEQCQSVFTLINQKNLLKNKAS